MPAQSQPFQDQAQRDVIAKELDTNLVVLAGAGAGKTYALVQRMVNVIRAGKADVGRMVAITFTRKAAGEMRARFNLWLQQAAREASGEEARRLGRALERSDQCFIGTIHAFCGRLLRERPLDAGLSPDFQEIDEREEARFRREAWQRYVLDAYRNDDPIFDVLDEVGLEVEDLFDFYEARCLLSDLPLKPTPKEAPDLDGAIEASKQLFDHADAFSGEIQHDPDDFYAMMETARRYEQNVGLSSLAQKAEYLGIVGRKNKVAYTKWGKNNKEWKEQAKVLRDELLPELLRNHVEPALETWRNYIYARVAPWVEGAVEAFRKEREEAGMLGFSDLLQRTAKLLRERSSARRFFQKRYTRLFVDEFQDTDPVQAEVLFYLTGTDHEEKDWRRLRPRPGSLFIVGDGKQSIYRFRRADVELFREVCQLIEDAGGKTLTLTTSFRSLGSLCNWINRAFEPLFEEDRRHGERYQAPFAPLVNVRGEGTDPHGVRKISISRDKGDYAPHIRGKEAEHVSAAIEQCLAGRSELNGEGDEAPVDRNASPGDFLILTRRTASLAPFAKALEERGIPYDVVGGKQLVDVVTVKALVELMDVVFEPENAVHYVAYLRGPLVGLSDPELLAFAEAGGSFTMEADLPEALDAELSERVTAAQELAKDARRVLNHLPPSTALERIIDTTGLASYHVFEEDGTTRAGSLARLTSMVRGWEQEGWHWGRILRELRELRDDRDYKQSGMTIDTGRADVVRLMNLHQVKGLQARVVFLVDCYDTSADRHEPAWHVARTADEPYAAIPIQRSKGPYHMETIAEPTGWPEDKAAERAFETAETLRLVYVGATRAENMLVVTCCPDKPDRGPWCRLFQALGEVPELALESAQNQDETGKLARVTLDTNGEADAASGIDVARARRRERFEDAKKESYTHTPVSGDEPEKTELDVKVVGRGEGAIYGTLVHELLEEFVTGRLPDDVQALVEHRCRQRKLDPKQCDQAVEVVRRFESSELYQRVRAAEVVYTEVPFAMAKSPAADGRSATELWRGTIDLIYRDDDGWHVVDYKTDLGSADDPRAEGYFDQVRNYAAFWEDLTDEKVVRQMIWSAVTHAVIDVPA